MRSAMDHIEDLVRHIGLVRDACLLLGRRLIAQGRETFGRQLIARGLVHDASKFTGIEWEYLHAGPDAPPEEVALAVAHHRQTNDHHPEFWGGFDNMPEVCVAEMVCDWYARAQEFGTDLRQWAHQEAVERYHIDPESEPYEWVVHFLEMLLGKPFAAGP